MFVIYNANKLRASKQCSGLWENRTPTLRLRIIFALYLWSDIRRYPRNVLHWKRFGWNQIIKISLNIETLEPSDSDSRERKLFVIKFFVYLYKYIKRVHEEIEYVCIFEGKEVTDAKRDYINFRYEGFLTKETSTRHSSLFSLSCNVFIINRKK